MDKPSSTWGLQANGEVSTSRPVDPPPQEEIDRIDSRYLREVYQEQRDKADDLLKRIFEG